MNPNAPHSDQKIRCVIYCRVSTSRQKREGLSLSAQEKRGRKYAEDNTLDVVRVFSEDESGSKSERKKFNEMLNWMRREKIYNLVLEKVDRFHRNMKGEDILKDGKLTVHFINEGMILNWKNSSAAQKFIFRIQSAQAAFKGDDTGEKSQEGMLQKAERGGFPGFAPIGYRNNIIKKTIDIDPDRAPLVIKLFELAATRKYSVRELTEMMKNLGLKSRGTRNREGSYLHKSTVDDNLRNPFYYGYFKWKDIDGNEVLWSNRGVKNDLEPTYEPLISKELYDEVQDVLSRKYVQRKRGKDFQFKGFITCGLCECSVVGETKTKIMKKTGKRKSFTYYHCTQGRGKCALPWFTEKEIEDAFVLAIESLYIDPQADEYVRKQLNEDYQSQRDNTKAMLQNLRSEQTKIKNQIEQIYQDKLDALITVDFFTETHHKKIERLEAIRAEISSLEEGYEQYIDEGIKILDLVRDFKNRYLSSKPDERKKINQLLFRTIYAVDSKFYLANLQPLVFYYNEPFATLAEIGFIQRMAEFEAEGGGRFRDFEKEHPLPDSNRLHKILSKSTFSPFYLTFPLCLDILFTVKSKGETVTKKCPKCQTDNPYTLKFCGGYETQLLSAEDFGVTKTIEAPREELTTGSTFAGRGFVA